MATTSPAIAIIPARGGSKGIPRKNLAVLSGLPLLAWTIKAAQTAKLVRRVVVSTDDAEISIVAEAHGAEVVCRPAEISGDTASSELAVLHALDASERPEGLPAVTVFLQCTSPLTSPEDIDGTINALANHKADTAVAVCPFHYFLWRVNEAGAGVGVNHDGAVRVLRQQRQPEYLETGAVYAMKTEGFRRCRSRFFGKTALYVMPAQRRWEIDEPLDLKIASVLLHEQEAARQAALLPTRIDAVVMDFDGVFTDNRVLVFDDGREAVVCSRSDGWGLGELRAAGHLLMVLSTEQNSVVAERCKKLGIDCLNGQSDKRAALLEWCRGRGVALEKIVYVGNDVNDLGCMAAAGFPIAVNDAHPAVRSAARMVLRSRGGRGALRELADLLIGNTPADTVHSSGLSRDGGGRR